MLNNLYWLGHASFRWEGSRIIYFDPWKIPKGSKKADFIFISHEHFDHCCADDLRRISTADTVIITDSESAAKLKSEKIACKEIKTLRPGENTEIAGLSISAVASYNTNKQFHPRGSGKLGFLVAMDKEVLYHAGDTDLIPEMKNVRCDVALLPVSGTYVMTADEAAEAAITIKPKVVIPMHYGDIVGTVSDAKRLQDLLQGKIEVKILKKES